MKGALIEQPVPYDFLAVAIERWQQAHPGEEVCAKYQNMLTVKPPSNDGGDLAMQNRARRKGKPVVNRKELMQKSRPLSPEQVGDFRRKKTTMTGLEKVGLPSATKEERAQAKARSKQLKLVKSEVRGTTKAKAPFRKVKDTLFGKAEDGSKFVSGLKKESRDAGMKLANFGLDVLRGDNFKDITIARHYSDQIRGRKMSGSEFGRSITREQMINHFKPAFEHVLKAANCFEFPAEVMNRMRMAIDTIKARPEQFGHQEKEALKGAALNILFLKVLEPAIEEALRGCFPPKAKDEVSRTGHQVSQVLLKALDSLIHLQEFPAELFGKFAGDVLRATWNDCVIHFVDTVNKKVGVDVLGIPEGMSRCPASGDSSSGTW